ncbi:hypothetical protein K491DRAFT_676795 [Lophiostoma macrostomum CBS 122681]|uniref:Uncharacterized protein n=1 Tax=Lophiostoma macrostomum CBS 122681 TaxID=1314788 RepID=A0A6A6TF89_9PLEO|nr:hypothetical protein K491DRAFT_676795 [Lophiostoma macrostomum CBS 122681]
MSKHACRTILRDWSDFVKAASITLPWPPSAGKAIEGYMNPYILVQSRSHQDFGSATDEISTTAISEFKTSTWLEIKDTFVKLAESANDAANSVLITPQYDLVLDEQSPKDHKVLFIEHDYDCYNAKGQLVYETAEPAKMEAENLSKVDIWRKHRIPYDKIVETMFAWDAAGGWYEDDDKNEYLEEEFRGRKNKYGKGPSGEYHSYEVQTGD